MSLELEDIEPGDDSEGCGYSWDHTLRLVDERDGVKAYECTECGAELTSEDK